MIDLNRLLDMLDSNGLIKRGDSRLPSDLNSASRPDKILRKWSNRPRSNDTSYC